MLCPQILCTQLALIAWPMPGYKKTLLVIKRRLTFDEKVFVLELIENLDGPSASAFRINKSSFNSKVMIIIY